MATATYQSEHRSANAQQESVSAPLEAAIAETERSRSLTGEAATFLGVKPSAVCNLLRNVWKTSRDQPPLTDAEMFAGISMIARFQLDPIAREVYVTRTKNGLATIVSIDGWIKILHRSGDYDGHEQDMTFDDKGNVESVTTVIHSKSRKHPTKYTALWKEYQQVAGFVSGAMPSHMLRIFSFRHAARFFQPLGASVVTEDELATFASAAPSQSKPITSLDALADRLAEPIQDVSGKAADDQAKEPQPDTINRDATAWDRYLTEIAGCDVIGGLTLIYDRYFGPDVTIEWTPEENAEATKIRDSRAAELRAMRSKK